MREITKQTRELLAKMTGDNQQLIKWLEAVTDNMIELPAELDEINSAIVQLRIDISNLEAVDADLQEQIDEILLLIGELNIGGGEATLDFGSFPGSNEAEVNFSNPDVTITSRVQVYFNADDSTSDHTNIDHQYAALFMSLAANTISGGGTIYAKALHAFTGTFKVRYAW